MAIVVAGRYVQLLFYFDIIPRPLCICVTFIKELGELLGRGATSAVFKGKDKQVPLSSSLFILIHLYSSLFISILHTLSPHLILFNTLQCSHVRTIL
jgi:hypothetical protein